MRVFSYLPLPFECEGWDEGDISCPLSLEGEGGGEGDKIVKFQQIKYFNVFRTELLTFHCHTRQNNV